MSERGIGLQVSASSVDNHRDHGGGDAPNPKDTTTVATPPNTNTLPAMESAPYAVSSIRSSFGCGLSLSSSYDAPHCGHFSALGARAGSSWAALIHCSRHVSWATRVHVHGCVQARGGSSGSSNWGSGSAENKERSNRRAAPSSYRSSSRHMKHNLTCTCYGEQRTVDVVLIYILVGR